MPELELQKRSPLEVTHYEGPDVIIAEDPDFELTQIAGEEALLQTVSANAIFKVTPKQLWILGKPPPACSGLYFTPLSASRIRVSVKGENAARLLARCSAIDFQEMKSGSHVFTGIHHTPVMIHAFGKNSFHIYAMRSFAQSVWDWLVDAAEGLDKSELQ